LGTVDFGELEELIGHKFANRSLLAKALTHASTTAEPLTDNERMELLGDAVLELAVTDFLYRNFTRLGEGDLTKLRSGVVNTEALAEIADDLDLVSFATLGRGLTRRGEIPSSVKANLVEAVLGAVHLDAGYEVSRDVVLGVVHGAIEESASGESNHKAVLQEHAQAKLGVKPRYNVVSERGPDHEKTFEVQVDIDGRVFRKASGRTKKDAEQAAALKALRKLGIGRHAPEDPDAPDPPDAPDAEGADEDDGSGAGD